ncbi:MAG TPA: copper-binding protein [Telluria sp.]
MNAISKFTIATVLAFASTATVMAQDSGHAAHAGHGAPAAHAAHAAHKTDVAGEMVDGEIRKIDKDAGKITIRHGELKALGMPAMTMAFRVSEPAMLGQVKVGDKVKFMAEKVNGAITIVHLESVK